MQTKRKRRLGPSVPFCLTLALSTSAVTPAGQGEPNVAKLTGRALTGESAADAARRPPRPARRRPTSATRHARQGSRQRTLTSVSFRAGPRGCGAIGPSATNPAAASAAWPHIWSIQNRASQPQSRRGQLGRSPAFKSVNFINATC